MDHRTFKQRYLAFVERQMKVALIWIAIILFLSIVTNLIW
jgi:hypothetical protein